MTRLENARKMRQRVNLGLSGAIGSGAVSADALQPIADEWRPNRGYIAGEICTYAGKLYKCAQGHTSQTGWEPSTVPALWVDMGVAASDPDAVPEWKQPTGAQDAYKIGDVVSHNGKNWVSTVDANTWEPGVYGWEAQAEE